MQYLGLNRMTNEERTAYQEACALTHREVAERLHKFHERGYITTATYNKLLSEHQTEYKKACETLKEFSAETPHDYTSRVLRVYAIGIETMALKDLYIYGEVSETTFKRIMGKLTLQLDDIEQGILQEPKGSIDGRDVFERSIAKAASFFSPKSDEEKAAEQYSYYRAQSIIARKVLKEIESMDLKNTTSIFTTTSISDVTKIYTSFKEGSQKKMDAIAASFPILTEKLGEKFASRGVAKVEEHVLEQLYERQFITPKLFVTLKEKFNVK